MRVIAVAALLMAFSVGLAAEDGLLASAERLAAEAVQAGQVETTTRSTARVSLGVALAAAGAAMLLIDPEQPIQPGPVSMDTLGDTTVDRWAGLTHRDIIDLRSRADAPVLRCEPLCPGAIDEAIVGAFASGVGYGVGSTISAIEDAGWQLYQGPFRPFEQRSAGLKAGGAALAIAGAVIAGFWSTTTVVRDMAVAPTRGGFQVGSRIAF